MKYKLIVFLVIVLILSGCAPIKDGKDEDESKDSIDILNVEWDTILKEAEGQNVNLYMWGGSDSINRYIDEWVKPKLKEKANVSLKRIPMNDTRDIINQLINEKEVGKSSGSMDIIWINGENFKTAKEKELLYGSINEKLPNYQKYINSNAEDISKDFGEEINGLETPWGKSQFVFVYDSEKISNPPKSMDALKEWVKKNPGKFTYPAVPDFTGSAFVRHVIYEKAGGYDSYDSPLNEQSSIEPKLQPAWEFLNEIEPYLWRSGETYPESLSKLDQMFVNGEVWMTMGYDPIRASAAIDKGLFQESTRTFVLEEGTLSNTHYLSIPFNSSHKAGALVAIDFLISPEAQLAKLNPKQWGDLMAIDPEKLSSKEQDQLSEINLGEATLSQEILSNHQLPEVSASYVELIEKGWLENVAKK